MSARRYASVHIEDEESYFASMTDVVIGLLFIFIIMLMFFAMRFQEATQQKHEETRRQVKINQKQDDLINELTDTENTRSAILEEIGNILYKKGISVKIVRDEGILRFPEEILFDRSKWELNAKGSDASKALGDALDQVLPCYTAGPRSREDNCPRTKAKIEAIFIEGHADSDPFRPALTPPQRRPDAASEPTTQKVVRRTIPVPAANVPPIDNLDLSALRATTTFRELRRAKQELSEYLSPHNTPVLSVSGYGEYRPVAPEPGESAETYKQRNRRIDIRILMSAPRSEDARQLQRAILPSEQ
jgi:flagellar motor protein MotB